MTPPVMFHAAAGTVGLLSGLVALSAHKGGPLHRRAGTVFVASMTLLGASGAWLGFAKGEDGNAIGGILTIYFILTAWMAARRRDGEAGLFEIGAFLFAAGGAAILFFFTFTTLLAGTAFMGGIPGFTFATVAAACALADLSVILRRGVSGAARVARHLWRMHLGLAVAVGSFFPGQLQLFPDYIQHIKPTILLFLPFFSVFGVMAFWLVRIRIGARFKSNPVTEPSSLPVTG